MPRRGVTISDVQRAIAALTAQGQNPSADNIRAFLGTGSKAKILDLMAELDAGPELGDVDASEVLPKELIESLSAAAAGWYTRAREDLKRHVDSAQAILQRDRAQLAEARAEAVAIQTHNEELEELLTRSLTETAAAKGENGTLRDELRRTQHELASAIGSAASERARADAATAEAKEARRQATEELNTRIELEREKAALQESLRAGRRGPKAK